MLVPSFSLWLKGFPFWAYLLKCVCLKRVIHGKCIQVRVPCKKKLDSNLRSSTGLAEERSGKGMLERGGGWRVA